MSTILTDDALYETLAPRIVGGALVMDVVQYDLTTFVVKLVGKLVSRDGLMFARDLTSCGEPVYCPAQFKDRPTGMLAYAVRHLFDKEEMGFAETIAY